MWLTFEAILLIVLSSILHVTALAVSARLTRVPIREIAYGFGWQLGHFGVIRLRALLIGGYVKLKDSRSEDLPADQCHDAFDYQPAWVQAAIPLTACLITLGVGLVVLGTPGWHAFVRGFAQVFAGALGPLSTAQVLISDFLQFIRSNSFLDAFGLSCVKFAAISLLPLPALSGGDAIRALARVQKWSPKLDWCLYLISLFMLAVLTGCWLVALGAYVWHNAT